MRINLASVFVQDQEKAATFYTDVLGFKKMADFPMGKHKWLTVVSPEGGETELLLEPNDNPAAQAFQSSIYAQGIPATSFGVTDVQAEFDRLTKHGVEFRVPPTSAEWGSFAIFDDTCGNLISLHQPKPR